MAEFEYTISPEEAAHYDAIRQQRGWDWDTLADYFDQAWADPTAPFFAKWAREQAAAVPSKRAAAKGVEKR